MKKTSMLATSTLMSACTALMTLAGFTSCNDDLTDNFTSVSASDLGAFTNLEQYSYNVPVNINVQGDWKIEFQYSDKNNSFCYASPDHGHGPATVKLCMLDNWTDQHNTGQMIVRDLSNSKNDRTYQLLQKCNTDNPNMVRTSGRRGAAVASNTVRYNQGLRTKAVGYGYNVTMAPGYEAVSINPIIALQKLQDAGNDAGAKLGICTSCTQETCSGDSYREIFGSLKVQSNGKVTLGGLTSELKNSFSMEQKRSNSHMFVYTTVDMSINNVYLSGLDHNNIRQFMTDNARRAIDGEGVYTTDGQGFAKLLSDYGSHLIMKSDLGGRLRYATTVDKSMTSNVTEAKSVAKMSYENKMLNGGSSVEAALKNKYESNHSMVHTKVMAMGGDPSKALAVNHEEKSVEEWRNSITTDNAMVVGLGNKKDDLIPLYDLVDTSTDAGKRRQEAMKQFFETGMANVMAYDGTGESVSSDCYQISIPGNLLVDGKTNASKLQGTLVYEAWANNKRIALVCQEYIPQISNMGPVVTVYPIHNNKPDFTNGRFLGNSLRPASELSWSESGTPSITQCTKNYDSERTVYVRGGHIFNYEPADGRVVNAEIKGMYLKTAKCKSDVTTIVGLMKQSGSHAYEVDESWIQKVKYDENYQYPLVKIGNHIWLRENFAGHAPCGYNKANRYGVKIENGNMYYTNPSVHDMEVPIGWHVAKSSDFANLKEVVCHELGAEGEGAVLHKDGTSGFNMEWQGWYSLKHEEVHLGFKFEKYQVWYCYDHQCANEHHMEYLTADDDHVSIGDHEITICKGKGNWAMPIRLVMN